MSDTTPFGFGKFVPGFDFLQNLTKNASGSLPQMPNLSSWIAPTISVEELDKRVQELKAVQFWLEQNSRALSATIQALEVQKMTLATLEGMNVSMGDVANAFKLNTADSMMGSMKKMGESLAGAAQSITAARVPEASTPPPAVPPQATPGSDAKAPTSAVDPMQWWGALTQQFQQIAGTVLADVAKQTAFDAAQGTATGLAKDAFKTATDLASQMATKGVQSVQEATRAATSLATAAVPVPVPVRTPVVAKKTTAAKNTTVAKDTPPAKKSAAPKTAAVAATKTAARHPASKAAR
ncbi:PhaM family polyhydroxyalkanoate granule multifunctional regulatory protein [Simplicispira psychrophila]|uniref:PhaM family polyhydroxyalkanoate granule multifunctional regulatory protein n=1 Tax=Simplicispira psychrophila TaxID=80882 RepID=UPI0005639BC7|nr:PhaM family polyhydroxyalkanoate granule multifunctional regulatory protein [Simplicispira psychrophila]